MSRKPAEVAQVEIEMEINADAATVWKALTESPSDWWPKDFLVTSKPVSVTMEAWPGGRLYESGEDGEGLLWGTIIAVTPEKALHFSAYIYPPYGGPCTSLIHIRLEEENGTTTFRLSDYLVGHIGDATQESLDAGWLALFGGMKSWIEA